MEQVARVRGERDTTGFIKLIHKQDGTLLGATIVAGRAGEMVHEWTVALGLGLRVSLIWATPSMFILPTRWPVCRLLPTSVWPNY